MIVLEAVDVHKSYGPRTVLRGISLAIAANDRVGIVGPNGSGKSTLLRVLAGEVPDDGHVRPPQPGVRIALLPQEMPALAVTVWEAALGGADEVIALRQTWTSLAAALSNAPEREDLLRRYGAIQHDLERVGGFDLEVRVREILHGVGLSEALWTQPVSQLSGGERTRLNLARTLVRAPDVFLLDEPTNRLDLGAIEWLEGFLLKFRGAVIIASHDRRFLDAFAARIVEIKDGIAREYHGNYTAYQRAKEQELRAQVEAYERHRQEVARLRDFVRRQLMRAVQIQAGPKAGRDHYGRIAKKVAKRGQAARKRLARLEAQAPAAPRKPDQVRVQLNARGGSGGALIHLRGVTKRFSARVLFTDVNLSLGREDRVGLIGPNGAGKTTLLRLLLGEEVPSEGEVWKGPSVQPGYLAQDQMWLGDHRRALDVVLDAGLTLPEARALLASLLFRGDRVFERVGNLSGGERTRLALVVLMICEANVLLLDEPTNHLDLPSRERLEEALEAYSGAIVVASHDRFLLDRLCTEIWSIERNSVRVYQAGYSTVHAHGPFRSPRLFL